MICTDNSCPDRVLIDVEVSLYVLKMSRKFCLKAAGLAQGRFAFFAIHTDVADAGWFGICPGRIGLADLITLSGAVTAEVAEALRIQAR